MNIRSLDGIPVDASTLKINASSSEVDELIFDVSPNVVVTGTSPATAEYSMLFGRKRRERREKQSEERSEMLTLTTFTKEEIPDFPSLLSALATPRFKDYLDIRKSKQLPFKNWEDFFEISCGKTFFTLLDEYVAGPVSEDYMHRMLLNGFAVNLNFPDLPLTQSQLMKMMETVNGIYDGYFLPSSYGLFDDVGIHELQKSVRILRQLASTVGNISCRHERISSIHALLSSIMKNPLLQTNLVLQEFCNSLKFQLDDLQNAHLENGKNIHYGPQRKLDSLMVDYGFWYVRQHYEAYLTNMQGHEHEYAPSKKVHICNIYVSCNSLMLQALLEGTSKHSLPVEVLKKNIDYISLANQSYAAYSMYDAIQKSSNYFGITDSPEIYMYSIAEKCKGHRNNFYKYLHLLRKNLLA